MQRPGGDMLGNNFGFRRGFRACGSEKPILDLGFRVVWFGTTVCDLGQAFGYLRIFVFRWQRVQSFRMPGPRTAYL